MPSLISSSHTHNTCLQECLSVTQKTLLLSYKETVNARKRDELQKRISLAIEEAEEEEVCGWHFYAVCCGPVYVHTVCVRDPSGGGCMGWWCQCVVLCQLRLLV